jgi:hypothetical protein
MALHELDGVQIPSTGSGSHLHIAKLFEAKKSNGVKKRFPEWLIFTPSTYPHLGDFYCDINSFVASIQNELCFLVHGHVVSLEISTVL